MAKGKPLTIPQILASSDPLKKKALFSFSLQKHSDDEILVKFNLWARYNFPKYFSSEDADFFLDIDGNNLKTYRGVWPAFIDIAFRGASKTARTKLFVAFCIANDKDHFRRYIKVLAADGDNSKQIVTDIYNMLAAPKVLALYPEIFEKTGAKREETMSSFTTSTGIKILADTVGTDQRGAIQEEARPDWIWYEDFENRKTLRSGRITKNIWENMEEARTGLAKGGSCIYTCNYISEQGSVHTLVMKYQPQGYVLIVPIVKDGIPTWSRYTIEEIEQMKIDDDDFEGERLCKPSASKEVMFDRDKLEEMEKLQPIKDSAGFKIFRAYNPSHRYGSGHDVAGGVGLDSSTSVFIDFSTIPAQVVATFKSNTIRPDTFGDEIKRESEMFGEPVAAPEKNNHGHATIARARQLEVNLYLTPKKDDKIFNQTPSEYGWHTSALTKPKMLFAFGKAVGDGLIDLNDPDLIVEAMGYTRNDLIDDEKDPRMTTRHFDLLIAAAIAWQMKDVIQIKVLSGEALAARWAEKQRNVNKSSR